MSTGRDERMRRLEREADGDAEAAAALRREQARAGFRAPPSVFWLHARDSLLSRLHAREIAFPDTPVAFGWEWT